MLGDLAAFADQFETLAQAQLVLGVHGNAAAAGAQYLAQHLVLMHQQRAGRGAHEDLDPAAAGQPFQFAEPLGVFRRCPDEEGVVAPGTPLGACELLVQGCLVDGGGAGVRHLEDRGDPAHDRGAGPALQVFLVLKAGLAEMDLGVDDPGQVERANIDDAALRHRDIGRDPAGGGEDFASGDDEIPVLRHASTFPVHVTASFTKPPPIVVRRADARKARGSAARRPPR